MDAKARSLTFAVIDAHRERIGLMLRTNKPATVFQRLRDEHGLRVSVTSFRRYLWSEFPEVADESKVTVLRPEVPAGGEGHGRDPRYFQGHGAIAHTPPTSAPRERPSRSLLPEGVMRGALARG